MGERKRPRPPLLHQGGEGRPQSGPSCEGALLEGAVLWTLTWWASHPRRAPAARVSLGASGPRKPPATNSIWGEKRQSWTAPALLSPAPATPTPAPTISREQRGPLVFSGSRQAWGWGLGGG